MSLKDVIGAAKAIATQAGVSQTRRIAQLLEGGSIGRLARLVVSGESVDRVLRQIGAGIGGNFSSASRARIARMVSNEADLMRNMRVNRSVRATIDQVPLNRNLFPEGLHGRRFQVRGVATIRNPETGVVRQVNQVLDFAQRLAPNMGDVRAASFERAEDVIDAYAQDFSDFGEFLVEDFQIIDIERAF